jgi:hypothetical protein
MNDLKDILKIIPKNKWLNTVKKHAVWTQYLKGLYPFTTKLNEQIYLFVHELVCPPKCKVIMCDKQVNWITNHYTTTCSSSCAQQLRKQSGDLSRIQDKMKATMMHRYGVTNASQSEHVINKRNQTMMDRYGALVTPHAREKTKSRATTLNSKGRQTIKQRYGVENASQIPGHAQRVKTTLQQNHGVNHPAHIPYVQEDRLTKRIGKYQDLACDVVTITDWSPASQQLKDFYENPNPRIEFKCNTCDHVEELAMETFRWRTHECGTPCIKCSGLNKGSLQERQLREYVESLGVTTVANDRSVLHPLELDIWLPEHNLAIEYCGLYWHSELHGTSKFSHLNKMIQCANKGIRLITIFEDEWLHKSQVVKDRIKNMLGLNDHRVGARLLTCSPVLPSAANKFCSQHHVQGVGKTVHAYGLYENNELVSVITFSALTPAKGSTPLAHVWELNRFCTKPGLTISGGASRMFTSFVRDLDPVQVVSYSDRRWNTGQVYAQLGFDHVHDTGPNYWYVDFKSLTRIHRYNLRKTGQDDASLTEWQNRQNQGWNRIWDCGHSKWIWNK